MIKQAAIAASLLLLASTASFAEGQDDDAVAQAQPATILVSVESAAPAKVGRQTLNAHEIAAIQYREPSGVVTAAVKVQAFDR